MPSNFDSESATYQQHGRIMTTVAPTIPSRSRTGVMVLGLLATLTLIVTVIWLSGGSYLLQRKLWMDEVHSWLLVTDESQSHAMNALADGVDFNPPAWFAVSRGLTRTILPATEGSLRFLSLAWMVLAVVGLYILLRRHFSTLLCLVTCCLTVCQPLLIHQCTEIRFYGFWCALTVWLCCVLQWQPHAGWLRIVRIAAGLVLAMLITTTHYFGILSLGLITLPLLLQHKTGRNRCWMALLLLGCGSFSLLCCLPFLQGQKAALTRPTWITAPNVPDTFLFLQTLMPSWQIIICVCAVLMTLLFRKHTPGTGLFRRMPDRASTLIPCICLSAMPLVIVAVSWLLQPALVIRYAIVGCFGVAPLFALMLHQCSFRIKMLVLAIALVGLRNVTQSCLEQWTIAEQDHVRLVAQLRSCNAGDLIIFEDRIEWMPVLHYHRQFAGRCRLADFKDSSLVKDSNLRIVQRDVGRKIQKWYPYWQMQNVDGIPNELQFYVVPYADTGICGIRYPSYFIASPAPSLVIRFEHTPDVAAEERRVR